MRVGKMKTYYLTTNPTDTEINAVTEGQESEQSFPRLETGS